MGCSNSLQLEDQQQPKHVVTAISYDTLSTKDKEYIQSGNDENSIQANNSGHTENPSDNDNCSSNNPDDIQTNNEKSTAMKPNSNIQDIHKVSYHELLIYGYCRDIESTLKQIIPTPIIKLFSKYYDPAKKVILMFLPLDNNEESQIFCQKIIAEGKFGNRLTEKLNVFRQSRYNDKLVQQNLFGMNDGQCIAANISLPKSVTNNICKVYDKCYDCNYINYHFDTYTLLFSYSSGRVLSAVGINEKEFNKKEGEDIIGVLWNNFPQLTQQYSVPHIEFSRNHGLLAFGGYTHKLYNLSFNDAHFQMQDMPRWKWKTIMRTNARRENSLSSVMIKHDKLMIVGGTQRNSAELIDLQNRIAKTSNTQKNRCNSGIAYDDNKERVLVAGGDRYSDTEIEIYDIHKAYWRLRSNSHSVHFRRPTLWTTNNEILYMATGKGDVQYIDLRSKNNNWMSHSAAEFAIDEYAVVL